jgi:5'-nucleotidase
MPYPIDQKLVVAVSSTVLFDLSLEHGIYLNEGLDAFRAYQRAHRHDLPRPGAGFPFIKRLLRLNGLAAEDEHPVEVVILSRYHADDGVRVMDAVREYGLDISRAFFMAGGKPYPYMASVNAALYLSTSDEQVREAVAAGFPAGHVLPLAPGAAEAESAGDDELRLAFDFDGVLAGDEAERVYKAHNDLAEFQRHELANRAKPLSAGPLAPLLHRFSHLQQLDAKRAAAGEKRMLRVAIVTARSAPAHDRLVTTLSALGLEADEVFLLGGIEKKRVLDILKPHIFFDDQLSHLASVSGTTPCAHIPFGIANPPPAAEADA